MPKLEPADQLKELVEKMRRPFEAIVTFASQEPQFTTRDRGMYAYLIAKPIRRLASALSVDREILVLFSTFEEQQQRTVKVVRELISESNGRLEPTVAIVVHRDPDGNFKLPKWGRSSGLAILPVFSGRMPTSSEELERHLCYELFSHDPFDVTGPVSDDENFFGRRNEALDLARKLQTGQIRSCLGIRKIGKTSVINRVIQESRLHHDCYCVVVDCSKDEIWSQTTEQLMTSVGEAIRAATKSIDQYATVGSPIASLSLSDATNGLLSMIKSASKPILIFIDEVDYITPGSTTTEYWKQGFNRFWRNFRSVYQEALRAERTVSVMVGGVSAKWFAVGAIDHIENAALAFIPEEYLSPLPRGASIAMIRKIARSAGLIFRDDAADVVSAACSDMPFWIRKACSYIHRKTEISSRPVTIDQTTASVLVTEFIAEEGNTLAQVALGHLFRVYPELLEPSLNVLTQGSQPPSPSNVTILRKYGILSNRDPIQPSGQMVTEALRGIKEGISAENLRIASAGESTEKTNPSSLTDWAEELAVVNKSRNLLEKRIRQMVLGFLRADGLQKKPKQNAKDRVLAALPTERRESLKNLPADDLMEKLYWLELKNLVVREWSLFAAVFGDRRKFEEVFDVVNDRPDTHAKEMDAADFALQRRSLQWLSERIASI
ncbi:ATP-binding protein [Occallatibacter riparius]|uniref:ATP-binding protein n=1 Tax=Occallatibacter riparius TaxID=1002689 RepID=A0A9J7BSY2_9BACT|nr:ATP-binding protein [Occallatibacter riparius]UWZ86011.1 ATP-binding protein [Occallatibacter riparius]